MPSEQAKAAISEAYKTMAKNIPGFRHRGAQKKMIAEIANTLAPDFQKGLRLAVIEGQTGTGKSIGYMLGAIPVAQDLEKTLVISTATVALQEQLITKDLPMVAKTAGLDFSYQIAKGRRRYACPRNIAQLSGSNQDQTALDFGNDHEVAASWERPPVDGELEIVGKMESMLDNRRWSGDFDEWESEIKPDLQSMLTTSNSGCSGRQCPWVHNCPFYKARQGLKEVDVVIANHDLVMADLTMGGGVILPKPEDVIYVFDEAHHLPDKAIGHFAYHTRIKGGIKTLETLSKAAERAAGVLQSTAAREQMGKIKDFGGQAREAMGSIRRAIEREFPAPKKSKFRKEGDAQVWRFEHGVTPEAFVEPGKEIAGYTSKVTQAASELHALLKKALKDGDISNSAADRIVQDMGNGVERITALAETWDMWSGQDPEGRPPMARWVSSENGEIDVAVSAITAAGMLRSMLWEEAYGVILTSATITALNSFRRFQRAAGLRDDDGTSYLRLASPFNYEKAGVIEVPQMKAEPSDQDGHTAEIVEYMSTCVSHNAGTLVLFASGWQMRKVAQGLPEPLKSMCLMQNELPKHEIIEGHGRRIKAGKGSLIFGLASFAEGVDLPRELCTHVVIAKLPFAVPDSPVESARAEWLESKGMNPFMEITVPDASLKLIQAVGRLIRSEEDYGRVTLLDKRVLTKRYGRQLLDSLPPMQRIINQPAGTEAMTA